MAVITHKDGTAAAVLSSNQIKQTEKALQQYEEDNAEAMAQLVTDFTADLQNLQEQIDASITSWFYTSDPSTNTPPASDWTTDQQKADHVGDLYYNKTSGDGWRWQYVSDHYDWVAVTDQKVLDALYAASKSQDTIDSKRRVFYNTPVTPYDRGDLWVQGSQGDILRADVARTASESYTQADWILASKYTDDTAADAAQDTADEALELAGTASQLAGTKTRVYYQSSAPTGGTYVTGDVWFDSDDDNKMYRWNGSSWAAVLLGNDALGNLSANKLTSGSIDAGTITVSNINGGNITSGTISASRIAAIDTIKYNSNNYSQVQSNGLHVYQGGNEVASFGSSAVLGQVASGIYNAKVDTNGFTLRKNTTSYFKLDSSGIEDVTHNIEIFFSSNRISFNASSFLFDSKSPFTTLSKTSETQTLSSGSGAEFTCTLSSTNGYTLLGIQSIETNHNQVCSIGKFVLTSSGAKVSVTNRSSSSQSVYVTVTFILTSLV